MGWKEKLFTLIGKRHYDKTELNTYLGDDISSSLEDNEFVDLTTYLSTDISGKVDISQGRGNGGKNVVTDSNGDITLENKPSIPSDVSDLTDNSNTAFTPKTHSHTKSQITDFPTIPSKTSDLSNDGDGTSGVTYVKSNDSRLTDNRTPTSHSHATSEVNEASAFTNIGSNANATQHTINDNINTKLGLKANSNDVYSKSETYTQSEVTTAISNAVGNLQLFEVVNSLPTSNIKDNRLYLIVNGESITNNSYDIYLRVNDNWEQLDKLEFDISNFYTKSEMDTLLNGKVGTSDSRLTDSRTPKSHTHGDITNTGTIGSTANLPLITSTSGKIATGSFGTTANTFCQGNDSRLSDSRTPTSHAHGNITNSGAIGTASGKIIITGSDGVLTADSLSNHISLTYDDSTGILQLNFS